MENVLATDFREFLKLLHDHEVKYLLIGGYAVNYHGYVRGTGDLDVWIASGKHHQPAPPEDQQAG
jgi:hypothetical protein